MAHAWWHTHTRNNWGKAPQVLSEEEKSKQRALGEEGLRKIGRSIMNFSLRNPPSHTADGARLLEQQRLGAVLPHNKFSSGGNIPYKSSSSFNPSDVKQPYKLNSNIGSGITQARVGSDIEDGIIPTGIQERTVEQAAFQTNKPKIYVGEPMDDNPPVALDMPTKTAVNTEQETPENTPDLWKTWGSLADDPKKRRDAYLGSIKNIYMKKMLLDGIANLTGGVSQGGSWAEMAIAELDAVEKFDSEQRLHNQWKALFFNENGDYNPPKNRKEAMERGQKLGYDSDQMKDIMSVFPKETDDRTTLQKNISFVLAMEEGPMKRSLMKKHGLIETDDLTAAEKSADRAVRDGIITEKERDAYIRSIFVPTDTSTETAAMKNFKWYHEAEGEEKRLIGELLSIDAKGGTVDLFSPSNIASLVNNEYLMDAFSEGEQARLIGIVKKMIPGFNLSADTGGKTSAPQAAIDMLMSNPTPEMRKAFRQKYGHLPEGL